MKKKMIAIVGPTASGKTWLGVETALLCGGEVVSADSMQVYRRMDIGTAKPTTAEMRGVPHHMIDVAEPEEDFSVARYVELGAPCIEDIFSRGRTPILVGGTGLYVDSLASGRTFAPRDVALRERLAVRLRAEGAETLLAELGEIDPDTAARLSPRDEKRILRGLELWYGQGITISAQDRENAARSPQYDILWLGLAFQTRSQMWEQVDRRVDEMMERGLAGEVRGLLDSGVPDTATSMQAIGYKELVRAIRSGSGLQEAAEEVKLRTRQYAKRQLTWFRRNQSIQWHLWGEKPDFAAARLFVTEKLEEFGI